jgi:hypothetical protein
LKLCCYSAKLDGVMDSAVGVMTGIRSGLVKMHPGRGTSPKLAHSCGPHPASYATSTRGSCPGVKRPECEAIIVLRLTPSWCGQKKLYCLPTRRYAPGIKRPRCEAIIVLRLIPSWCGQKKLYCLPTRRLAPGFSNPHVHHPRISNLPRIIGSDFSRHTQCSVLRRSDFEQSHLEANTPRDKLGGGFILKASCGSALVVGMGRRGGNPGYWKCPQEVRLWQEN